MGSLASVPSSSKAATYAQRRHRTVRKPRVREYQTEGPRLGPSLLVLPPPLGLGSRPGAGYKA
jgi:hypothetical protein